MPTTDRAEELRELELKLEIAPEAAESICDHPLLKHLDHQSAALHAVYFDTSNHKLRENGFMLRVRRSGDQFVQTLKRGDSAAGVFDRDEWECHVGGLSVDTAALRRTPLRKRHKLVDRLEPFARSSVQRSTWTIERDECRIEVALDDGRIEAGPRKATVVELELELKRGARECLFETATDLARAAPLRLSAVSKGERAHRLATGESDSAKKASSVELEQDWSVATAFATIVLSCLQHFRLNEPLILERCDAAALHQARVSMRRLRAAFALFGSVIRDSEYAPIRAELRWFTSSLGDARNIDVFLKHHEQHLSKRDLRKLRSARKKAYATATGAIDSERLRTLLLALLKWVETGEWRESRKARARVRPFAAKRLDRLWTKMRSVGPQLASLDEEQQHRFRIHVKKMRYAIEFLGSLFDRAKVRSFTRALEAMQDSLGNLNDLATARQLAEDLSLDFEPGAGREGRNQIAKTLKSFSRLEHIGPFWSAGRKG